MKKALRKILKWVVLSFVFFIALILLVNSVGSYLKSGEDFILVKNAELSFKEIPSDLMERKAFEGPIKIHRISSGRGVVLGYRKFSDPIFFTVDDEGYSKITIWFPNGFPKAGEKIDLHEAEDVVVYYSSGGSAWIGRGCHGKVSQGTLSVKAVSQNSIRVLITGNIQSKTRYGLDCEKNFSIEGSFKDFQYKRLTPWLGAFSTHPYRETYRRSSLQHEEIELKTQEIMDELE